MNELIQDQDKQGVQEAPSGIFEPKPLQTDKLPLTGPQKAFRLLIIITVLLLCAVIWLLMRNPFMKPVKNFYRGLSHHDVSIMTTAFPQWLTDAKVSEETATITDMCYAVLSGTALDYSSDATAKVSLASKSDVSKEYLKRIEEGIQIQYQKEVHVSKGIWAKLRVYYTVNGLDREEIKYVRVYKIDGKWYLLDIPSDSQ